MAHDHVGSQEKRGLTSAAWLLADANGGAAVRVPQNLQVNELAELVDREEIRRAIRISVVASGDIFADLEVRKRVFI